jgi:hypothetical protein
MKEPVSLADEVAWLKSFAPYAMAATEAQVTFALEQVAKSMSEIGTGAMVRHTHRASPGRVLAVAEGYAMVRWPDWREPDLCKLTELRPALTQPSER